jgi:GT2 family glycosyltransferase
LAYDVNDKVGAVFPRQFESGGRFVEIEEPQGFCFMVRRDLVEDMGEFNKDFLIKPDQEYFKRMRNKKLRFIEARRAVVDHAGGGTSSKLWSLTSYTKQVQKELAMLNDEQ